MNTPNQRSYSTMNVATITMAAILIAVGIVLGALGVLSTPAFILWLFVALIVVATVRLVWLRRLDRPR